MTEAREIEEILLEWERIVTKGGVPIPQAGHLRALIADWRAKKAALEEISAIEDSYVGSDWQEIEQARAIAQAALNPRRSSGDSGHG